MERMVEKGKNGYYIPSDRGTFGVEVDQYGEIEKTRFTGTVVADMCKLAMEATPELHGLLVPMCVYCGGVCHEMNGGCHKK